MRFLPVRIFLVAAFCLVAICVQTMPSLINGLGMAGLGDGLSINFGVARGIGSASFAVCSLATGFFIDKETALRALPVLYALVGLTMLVAVRCFPKTRSEQPQAETSDTSLWKNGRLMLVLIGATLLYVSHNCLCNYLLFVTERCGGTEADQGVCLSIAAFCELPVMFLFAKMLKLGKCNNWLKLSGLFMGLRVLGCLLAPNIATLYGVQFFQLLGFALFSVSSVIYIDSLVDAKDTVRAQAMLASTCTLSNIIAFLIGGVTIDRFGINAVLLISTICAAVGTVILVLFAKKSRREGGAASEDILP